MKTVSDFLADVRLELDDLANEDDSTDGCLWSDAELLRYTNEAASAVARRTYSYRMTYELTVTANDAMVVLPEPTLLRVYRAYLSTANRILDQMNLGDERTMCDYGLRVNVPDYETVTGTPTSYMLDYSPGYLRLFPIPTVADTLNLFVAILPEELETSDDMPFNDLEDLQLALLYVMYRAYSKHDADTFNPTKARDNKAQFDERARLREPEYRRHHRVPGTVKSSW